MVRSWSSRALARPRLRRAAALVTAATVTGVLATGGIAGAAPSQGAARPTGAGSIAEQVKAMQAKVESIGAELAAAAETFEAGSAKLDVLLQKQFAAQRRLEGFESDARVAQARLNAVARRAYTRPLPETWSLAMSVDPKALTQSLETLMVLRRIGATQRGAVESFTRQQTGTAEQTARWESLREQAQAEQARLDAQLTEIRFRSAEALRELQDAQAKLDLLRAQQRMKARARAAAAAAAAAAARQQALGLRVMGTCAATADGAYANGFLPPEMLCPLRTAPGQQLAAQAAAAFDQLSTLHVQAFGKPLCVTDSYRSYAEQIDVFARKPSLAATPGRSQHGWGLALDLCGGVERFDTAAFMWMKANAPSYGFIHPDWAEPGGGRPEPWHWEFVG